MKKKNKNKSITYERHSQRHLNCITQQQTKTHQQMLMLWHIWGRGTVIDIYSIKIHLSPRLICLYTFWGRSHTGTVKRHSWKSKKHCRTVHYSCNFTRKIGPFHIYIQEKCTNTWRGWQRLYYMTSYINIKSSTLRKESDLEMMKYGTE